MTMIQTTPATTIGDLYNDPRMGQYGRFLFSVMNEPTMVRTLDNLGYEKCGMQKTIARLEEMAAAGMDRPIPLYSAGEIAEDDTKAKAEMLYFPCGSGKPYMMVIPGGAYAREWGLVEGLAIAVELNRLGYPAFVLFYRTKNDPPFDRPVLPMAIEDLTRAIRLITEHAGEYGVKAEGYAVAGFSAGAHLTAEWGTDNMGWKATGLPAPAALVLGYPPVDLCGFIDVAGMDLSRKDDPANAFFFRIGGYDVTRRQLEDMSPAEHMGSDYPPTCVYACEDDGTVPVSQGKKMLSLLQEKGVPHAGWIGQHGGHSFGLGIGTDMEGWLEDAVRFWQRQA